MIRMIFQCMLFFVVMTLLTGAIYPLLITGVAQLAFKRQADGDATLVSQAVSDPTLFWPRPSPASNWGPTSDALAQQIKQRRVQLGSHAPIDLVTASGSGLDPHISPEAARFQIARVAAARQISEEDLRKLVEDSIEPKQFGFLGQARVNVAKLNGKLAR